jgi:phospholipid transport system substrate-binding protein
MIKRFILLSVLLCLAGAASRAGVPTDEVRATTDKVLALLNTPNLQGDAKRSERHHRIRAVLDERFDWQESARGCLGRHWAERTPAEQKEFVTLFVEFLERSYLGKFDLFYVNVETIDYRSEKIIDNCASVQTMINTKAKFHHPVEYRLEKSGSADNWRIYDTVIEGVSMVKNYRDQFNDIIAKSSYAGLIREIKARVGEKE